MASDHPDPRTLITEVLTARTDGLQWLPTLLGLLDTGDHQVRLGATTALCVVALDHPETVPSLVPRLADRMDGTADAEVQLATAYLAAEYPDRVATALDEVEDDVRARIRSPRSYPNAGRSDTLDVGRTTAPGDGSATGPQKVYTRDEDEKLATDEEPGDAEAAADEPADADEDTDDPESMQDITATLPSDSHLADDTDWLPFVEYESRFEELSVLAPRDRRRYCDAYRTLGTTADEELAVALRHLHVPEADSGEFASRLGGQLDTWSSVSDLENVVTLYDWAVEPRLWAATEYTEQTLADSGRFPLSEALWHAERLARVVATLHERGVVHGGIDPENVAYYGNVLADSERQPPLLDNVGLLSVYRQHANPARYLDPRYAAPEYYDRRYGRVDHATDIYQLGAVCYRLFTGDAPYTGAYETVRDRVLDAPSPLPSDDTDVPAAVDDVVGKAMAKQKLTRYETAAHLAQELRTLRDTPEDDGR